MGARKKTKRVLVQREITDARAAPCALETASWMLSTRTASCFSGSICGNCLGDVDCGGVHLKHVHAFEHTVREL